MSSVKTNLRVGLFVISGFAIASIALIWLGVTHYFEKGQYYEAYFDESVQGLEKDSPVKYRGVSIGRVKDIGVGPEGNLIRVVMQIESGLKKESKDVVARLKSVGITGIMFIEIDRKGEGYSQEIFFPTQHPVIETRASDIKKFTDGIDAIINQLKEFDLNGISSGLRESFELLNKTIKDTRIEEISSDVKDSFDRIKSILDAERWSRIIGSIERLTLSLTDFSESGGAAMKSGEKLIKNTDARFFALQRSLSSTAQDIESVALNLKRLIEVLTDQPSRVIFNRHPPERKFEMENSK